VGGGGTARGGGELDEVGGGTGRGGGGGGLDKVEGGTGRFKALEEGFSNNFQN
jgi:hypothetical protein